MSWRQQSNSSLDAQQTAQQIRRAAMDLLARREHSFDELVTKLARRFSLLEAIEQQVQRLADEGLQSDERFVESFVNERKMRGKGPRFIRQELNQKGIAAHRLEQALDERNPEWQQLAARAYQKKFADKPIEDQKDKAKRLRFMQARGFLPDDIYRLLNDTPWLADQALDGES
jgi:regulatory protein